jgi:hypothetical protein
MHPKRQRGHDKLTFHLHPQGGMSNEMYNTIARVTDGIYEGNAAV